MRDIKIQFNEYYPNGVFPYIYDEATEVVRTEVDSFPLHSIITLDQAKQWVGEEGNDDSDDELTLLINAASNYLCGPRSRTSKCFRDWTLIDVYELCDLKKNKKFELSYPITQEIDEVFYFDESNNYEKVVVNASKYRLIKKGMSRSVIVFLEDIFTDLDEPQETQIKYSSSSDLVSSVPKIDPMLTLLAKYIISDAFTRRASQIGISEGAGVINRNYDNLLKMFLY